MITDTMASVVDAAASAAAAVGETVYNAVNQAAMPSPPPVAEYHNGDVTVILPVSCALYLECSEQKVCKFYIQCYYEAFWKHSPPSPFFLLILLLWIFVTSSDFEY